MTNVDEVSSDEFDIRDFDSDDLDAIPDDAIHDKSQGPLTIDDVLDHRTDSEDGDNDETDHVAASILASMQPLQRMPARPCQNPEPEAKRRKTTTEGAPRLKTRSAESDWTRPWTKPQLSESNHVWVCTACLLFFNNRVPAMEQDKSLVYFRIAQLCILPPFTRDHSVPTKRTKCANCEREKFCLPIVKSSPECSPPPLDPTDGDVEMTDSSEEIDPDKLSASEIARYEEELLSLRKVKELLVHEHLTRGEFQIVEELLADDD